ncbi:peroxisomal fatty acid beta-oxidation multifunctional protein AIM1-like [Coffea eugenioides]|uniref:peroxisomal fatty acid beta-oxidation multifunctional protein AIM1-like n=1 Tax=Coffea eugenioides TaxID=49369 RepID=UPI000F60CCC2|nr:peroxisomal fatty acid beta-oxidation multifunctional protein AIM1-like [Coffea eugenioides]
MANKEAGVTVSMEVEDDGIALITIRNPPVNALSLSVIAGLREKYGEAMRRDDVKAIVLTGADGKFCGGLDISFLQEVQKTGNVSLLPNVSFDLVVNTIEDGKKPSVAAIQGFALGGGLELAMGCSARIAAPRAELGLPELKLGIIPGSGGTQRLPRLVGVSKAIDMMLSSKTITSEEGAELGVIDSIASPDELLTASRQWALDIVEGRRPHINSLHKSDKLVAAHDLDDIFQKARQNAQAKFPNEPHYGACLDVIEEGIISGPNSGLPKEDKVFKELLLSNTARGLLHVFFSERATSKVPAVTDSGFKARKIEKVAVIGGGLMGSGIATALVVNNIHVILKEINSEYLRQGLRSIEANLQGLLLRGELEEDKMKKALSLLQGALDYEEFKNVDMVIEAVNEDISLKQSIFEELEKVCSSNCILASNTSTIDLNVIGERTTGQDRIVGAHLFSPAHVMPLMEIVRTERTSPKVVFDVMRFAKIIKKVPIVVKNCTCFAANRLFLPYLQAADMLANLGVDIFRIDQVICEFGMRIGPFQVQDVTGYDVYLAAMKEFAAAYSERTFLSPLVQLMQESGRAGKKNGKGYYVYERGSRPKPDASVQQILEQTRELTRIVADGQPISLTDQDIVEMIFFPVINEACHLVDGGVVVRASDIDIASVHGMKFPSYYGGILFWADSVGPGYICSRLTNWFKAYGNFFKPSKYLEERASKGILLGASST